MYMTIYTFIKLHSSNYPNERTEKIHFFSSYKAQKIFPGKFCERYSETNMFGFYNIPNNDILFEYVFHWYLITAERRILMSSLDRHFSQCNLSIYPKKHMSSIYLSQLEVCLIWLQLALFSVISFVLFSDSLFFMIQCKGECSVFVLHCILYTCLLKCFLKIKFTWQKYFWE